MPDLPLLPNTALLCLMSRHYASPYDKRVDPGVSRYVSDRRDERHRDAAMRLDDKVRCVLVIYSE